MLCCGKDKIYGEIKLIVYQLKCYSPTSIISLALLVLRPKLVLLLTNVFQSCLSASVCLLSLKFKRHGVFYTFAIPEAMWYEPLYKDRAQPNVNNKSSLKEIGNIIY